MVGAASPEEELLSALLGNVSCTVSSKLLFFLSQYLVQQHKLSRLYSEHYSNQKERILR